MKKIITYGTIIALTISFLLKPLLNVEIESFVGRFFYHLEHLTSDTFYQQAGKVSDDIFVIGIDEATLDRYGPWHTWTRDIMGEMISRLNENPESKPAVIGVDIMYFGEAEGDAYLVQKAQEAGNVVMASQLVFEKKIYEEDEQIYIDNLHISQIEYPFQALKDVTYQGHVNVLSDHDGIVRNSVQLVDYQGDTINSFSYEVYKQYLAYHGLENSIQDTLQSKSIWHIPYTAKPGDYYNQLSFAKVLEEGFPVEIFKDAIVLIGPYAPGMMDRYPTPISRQVNMDGVEIHANIIQSLLEENFKIKVPVEIQQVLIAGIILGWYLILKTKGLRWINISLIGLLAAWGIGCRIAYKQGYIMTLTYLPIVIIGLYIIVMIRKYYVEYKKRKQITQTFKQYVAPQVVEKMIKTKNFTPTVGGERRDIAVFFVDIRGFTTVSEELNPEQIVEILNIYLDIITTSVYKFGGTLDKFIGDAAMAIFNAPFEQDDYVYQAVATTQDIMNRVESEEEVIRAKYGVDLKCGIGIQCGEAVVGNIGTAFRMDYTAIGDVVNTAARLESKAKAGEIIISAEVKARLGERIKTEFIGNHSLKGKNKEMDLYRLVKIEEKEVK